MLLNKIFDIPNGLAWVAYMVLIAVGAALASQSMEGWGWCLLLAFLCAPNTMDDRDRLMWLIALLQTVGLAIVLIVAGSDIGWGWLLFFAVMLAWNGDALRRNVRREAAAPKAEDAPTPHADADRA